MNIPPPGPRARHTVAVALAAALLTPGLAVACRTAPGQVAGPSATPSVETAPAGFPPPPAGATAAPSSSATRTLSMWTVAELEPETGDGLSALASAWSEGDSLTTLRVSRRPGRGENGVLTFLEAISRVAPAALPDIAPLPLADIAAARRAGLLRPLPEALARSAQLEQSWPFARAAVSDGPETTAWAMPLAVTFAHVAWPEEPTPSPGTWPELLEQTDLVLSTSERSGTLSAALSLYAAHGGDPGALPSVDRDAAQAWLDSLAAERTRVSAADSTTAAIDSVQTGAAVLGAGEFVGAWLRGEAAGWSMLPGPTGPAPVIATGWALALIARPEAEAGHGAALIEALTATAAPTWTFDAGLLPPGGAGWAESLRTMDVPPPPAYRDFVALRLESARAPVELAGTAPLWSELMRSALGDGTYEPTLDLLTAPR